MIYFGESFEILAISSTISDSSTNFSFSETRHFSSKSMKS